MKLRLYSISPFVLQNLIWVPTRLIYKFFAHLKVRGLDNLNNLQTGVIFAVNHSSELDPITLTGSLPFLSRFSPMFYVSREQTFYKNSGWRQKFYGGLFFKAWGSYPAYVGLKNYEASLVNHTEILRDRHSVCIFPEGKKSKDGTIGKGKGGIAYLSWVTGKPIVPVGINGSFQSKLTLLFARKKNFTVTFGPPIYPRELFTGNDKPVLNETRDDFIVSAQTVMLKIKELTLETSLTSETRQSTTSQPSIVKTVNGKIEKTLTTTRV